MSKNSSYNEIKIKLKQLVASTDCTKQNIEEFVCNYKDTILDIYNNLGSGNQCIKAAYDDICFSNHKLALSYQDILEENISGDVLFMDE